MYTTVLNPIIFTTYTFLDITYDVTDASSVTIIAAPTVTTTPTNTFARTVNVIWNKVFKSGPSKICRRQPLKNLKDMVCLSRPYLFKFFKGCLPQILLGPLLNTLSHS